MKTAIRANPIHPRKSLFHPLAHASYQGRRIEWSAYLFLAPFLVFFILIQVLPIVYSFYISFNEWGIVGDPKWVGFKNFNTLIEDAWVVRIWSNTLKLALLIVPGTLLSALAVAMYVNRNMVLSGFVRTAFFAPHVIAVTVTAIIWIWILEKETGLLNTAIYALGFPKQGWLTTRQWVLLSISAVTIWQALGFHMVILLAGLKEIPVEVREAATVDGASGWQVLWWITLPLLRPALGLVITLEIIASFRIFGQVYLMTGGGPGGSSATIVSYIYHIGFTRFQLGYAAALSLLLFATILLFTLLRVWLVREQND